MTDLVAVAMVTGTFGFLTSILSFLNHRVSKRNNTKITSLERSTNGRLDQLLDERGESAYHRGFLDGENSARNRGESKL